MKIGILTYHSVPNFGANLQALSTVGFLKKNGHEPIIINWLPEDLATMYATGRVKSCQVEMHKDFSKKYLPMSRLCETDEDIVSVIVENDIEGIIVGSDAIWHHVPQQLRKVFSFRKFRYVYPNITTDRNYPNPFWGSFHSMMPNIPICAFSASSQNMPFSLIKDGLKRQIGESLKQFKYISVRDNWTKKLVEYFTENTVSPCVTPDPVFAFNNNTDFTITKQEILDKFGLPDRYILVSFRIPKIDKNWIKEFETKCTENGFTCVGFPMPEGLISFGLNKTINVPLDTIDWYNLIKYSSGYVGERMHPIIVSLHNCVPFYCFDEYGTYSGKSRMFRKFVPESSKIYDILNRANMSEYMYNYHTNCKVPTPELVLSRLLFFDFDKCRIFFEKQYFSYKVAMQKEIEYLQKM